MNLILEAAEAVDAVAEVAVTGAAAKEAEVVQLLVMMLTTRKSLAEDSAAAPEETQHKTEPSMTERHTG